MKKATLFLVVIVAVIWVLSSGAQDSQSVPLDSGQHIQSARDKLPGGTGIFRRYPPAFQRGTATAAEGVGICLIGKQYVYVTAQSESDKCDAFMWIDAASWARNQRMMIDRSRSSKTAVADDSARVCGSCSGTCQIVSWISSESQYESVETDGGQSPVECLADIRQICESGVTRHLASANCGN